MSFTNVDRVGTIIIRKLHSPKKDKDFGYILVTNEVSDGKLYSTLTEARNVAGFVACPVPIEYQTKPKLSNPQNQKGYRGNIGSPKAQKRSASK